MRIPTLIALGLLIIAIVLGVFLFWSYKNQIAQAKKPKTPFDIRVVNITDSSVTVIWQTSKPTLGAVLFGPDIFSEFIQRDDREDIDTKRLTHFVTIKNLPPDKEYFFQVKSDQFTFPNSPIKFKTAKLSTNNVLSTKPVWGITLDQDLQPIDEAIISLSLKGANDLATYTTDGGNYLLSLTELRDKNLSSLVDFSDSTQATLTILRADAKTDVKILLPPTKDPLPPIILGEDMDLSEPQTTPLPDQIFFDLNRDGIINSLDLGIVLNNFGKEPHDAETDLNEDGVVDESDIDLLKQALAKNQLREQGI